MINRLWLSMALISAIAITGCESNDHHDHDRDHDDHKHDDDDGDDHAHMHSANPEPIRLDVRAPSPRDGLIPVGDKAPNFQAVDHAGHSHELSELLESQDVVLIFYPKDDTPTCTKQLCAVRDDWSKFQAQGAIVLGVNPADATTHSAFAEKYSLQFPVLVDEKGYITAGYGARNADKPEYPIRTVYVIRQDGRVALADRGVVEHDKIFAALQRP